MPNQRSPKASPKASPANESRAAGGGLIIEPLSPGTGIPGTGFTGGRGGPPGWGGSVTPTPSGTGGLGDGAGRAGRHGARGVGETARVGPVGAGAHRAGAAVLPGRAHRRPSRTRAVPARAAAGARGAARVAGAGAAAGAAGRRDDVREAGAADVDPAGAAARGVRRGARSAARPGGTRAVGRGRGTGPGGPGRRAAAGPGRLVRAGPAGRASIAQVQAAVLHDGTEVIVKVQRPGIPELVERDLDIVGRLAAALADRTAWERGLGLEELDFRVEGRNMTAVRRAARARGGCGVTVPVLYGRLSSERVLVMSRVEGPSLGKAVPHDERRGSEPAETLLTAGSTPGSARRWAVCSSPSTAVTRSPCARCSWGHRPARGGRRAAAAARARAVQRPSSGARGRAGRGGFSDLSEASRAYASARMADRMGPQTARDAARDELVALLPVLRRLPRRLDRLGGALDEGRLGVNVRLFAHPRYQRVAGELVGRVVHALVGIFLGFAGLELLGRDGGPRVYGLMGCNLLLLSAAVVLRTVHVTSRPMD
ncbi:AarF/UbiB family protein [Streptomyces katrae]|uniref:AarF/UbiB family protein n=1 Tax=Streptomyces katrae TaxID=68223 RepID=A0ABT7H2J2_9ACTN|nr:AarF/UbiB family protein [Streptomyces katrae]MDK9499696.1 AarF/UbiB family protein [Streptomyces katrae]